MLAMRRFGLGSSLLILCVASCGHDDPLAPNFSANKRTLSAPSNATATAISSSEIAVTWRDNSGNEDGFEVYVASDIVATFGLWTTTGPNATSAGFSGIAAEQQYCVKIRALMVQGKNRSYSAFSNTACATTLPPPLPAAPSGLDAMPAGGSIRLIWLDNATNEAGFRVERSTTSNGPWTAIASLGQPNVHEYFDGQSPAEQPACYRVFAVNNSGDSPSSNVDCAIIPAAPSDFVATATGSDVDLSWTDNSGVEEGFRVLRNDVVLVTLPANTTAYHDPGLADGTYYYSVFAIGDGGSSVASRASVTVLTAPPFPPFAWNAYPISSDGILVTWSGASFDLPAGYYVERSSDGGTTWMAVGEVPGDEGTLVDWTVWFEQEFCYRVFAFNSIGSSDPSNIICTAAPASPSNLQATPANISGAIDLTWTDNSNVEDSYLIFRHAPEPFCPSCYALVATVGPNVTSYRDSGLNPAQSYTYYVVATKGTGHTGESNYASAIAP